MARDKKPVPGHDDRQPQEEMTVVVLKFKGGSASLQKGFDAVTQAIAALGMPAALPPRIAVRRPAELAADHGEILETETDDAEEEPAAPEEATNGATGKKKKSTLKYTFMDEFNLSPDGHPSLKDYCTEKNPQTEVDKFLTASAWIMEQGGEESFTGRHLFTCFRAMNWKTQADMTQPLRALKLSKSYYDNPTTGKWKLTGIGLDAAHALGQA